MTETNVFQRGEDVPIWAENKTWAGVLTDPSSGVKITLYKPDGTLAKDGDEADINDTAMGKEEVPVAGRYVYYYSSASDDPVGWWRYFCKAVDGDDSRTVIKHGGFRLD